jgi:hypothetical protein
MQSFGRLRFPTGTFGPPAVTPGPIDIKICTIVNVREVTRCAKNDSNRLSGVCSHVRGIYSYQKCLASFFILRHTYSPNGHSHLDQNASFNADFRKKCLFGVSRFAKKFLGVIFAPKNCKKFVTIAQT